jgi:hypothetical protein
MAALPLKAFSGKVESGFGSEGDQVNNATKSMQHSQEQPAVANAAAESCRGAL